MLFKILYKKNYKSFEIYLKFIFLVFGFEKKL